MPTRQQREEIRTCIVNAAKYNDSAPANVFGGGRGAQGRATKARQGRSGGRRPW